MDQERINSFYRKVEDIQALYRSDISGNLSDYFQHRVTEQNYLFWLKDPGTKIRNQVIAAAHEFLI